MTEERGMTEGVVSATMALFSSRYPRSGRGRLRGKRGYDGEGRGYDGRRGDGSVGRHVEEH